MAGAGICTITFGMEKVLEETLQFRQDALQDCP